VGVLLADVAVVMHLVAQVVGNVTLVDTALSAHILRVERRLHGGLAGEGLLLITVIEVGIFEELDPVRVQRIVDSLTLGEDAIILALASEATIAGLEV